MMTQTPVASQHLATVKQLVPLPLLPPLERAIWEIQNIKARECDLPILPLRI